jgi:hypothetical protein
MHQNMFSHCCDIQVYPKPIMRRNQTTKQIWNKVYIYAHSDLYFIFLSKKLKICISKTNKNVTQAKIAL